MHQPGSTPQDRFPAAERLADGAQFVAGRLTKGTSGRTHAVVDPATGAEVYTYDLMRRRRRRRGRRRRT